MRSDGRRRDARGELRAPVSEQLVGHVDVAGDDRIDAIATRDDIVVVNAVEAETLDGWQINVGQKAMPFRVGYGVYRTPSVAASGMPAVLRHRFWLPPEKEQVCGLKYIGLLLYASERDDCRYTLRAGAELLGTVRPERLDNRRHLIVAERQIEILGAGVPFTVRAEGTGPCYLEKLLFLTGLPEASSFAPRLDRLGTRVTGPGTVELHGIASEPVTVTATAIPLDGAGATVTATSGDPYPLLALPLRGLTPGQPYRIDVEAREPGGEVTRATVDLPADAPAPEADAAELRIPVEVVDCGREDSTGAMRCGAAAPAGLPLTFAVPLPRGALRDPAARVSFAGPDADSDGEETQVRVHARWPDGSARWALLDTCCPGAVPASGVVRLTAAASAAAAGGDLTWSHEDGIVTAGNGQLRLTVRQGGALFERIEVLRDGTWATACRGGGLHGALGSGVPLVSGPVEEVRIEEAGPRRLAIRAEVPVADPGGVEHLHASVLVQLHAGQPFLTLAQRLVVVSPLAGAAMHGDLSHLADSGADAADVVGCRAREGVTAARALAGAAAAVAADPGGGHPRRHHRCARTRRARAGGTRTRPRPPRGGRRPVPHRRRPRIGPPRHRKRGRPVPAGAARLLGALPEGAARRPGHARRRAAAGAGRAGRATRLRARVAPPLLLARPAVRLLPAQGGQRPCHRANAVLRGRTASGRRRRPTGFHGHLAVRPDFDYLGSTGVLEPLAAKHDSPHPPYERMVDRAFAEWLEHRAGRHEVGFMNYGDTFKGSPEAGGFWENNEYDAAWCHLVEFLRGGDPRWLPLGCEAARHMLDIDTCNHSRDPAQVGAQVMHMAGHVGGYLPPYFRNKMAGSTTVPSHMWVQGPALHFLLTGDPFAREVLEHTARWMTANLRWFSLDNARECGWQLTHLCALDRLGDDPRYLNAAAIIVEHVLAAQSPGGGWQRVLTASHGGRGAAAAARRGRIHGRGTAVGAAPLS